MRHNDQLTQTYVTDGTAVATGTYLMCYGDESSNGNQNSDFVGQLEITVVAPALTTITPDNANAAGPAAGVAVLLSVDAPDGDYVALVLDSDVNCAGLGPHHSACCGISMCCLTCARPL